MRTGSKLCNPGDQMSDPHPDPRHARLFALIHQQARANHVAARLARPAPPSQHRLSRDAVMARALISWERQSDPLRH